MKKKVIYIILLFIIVLFAGTTYWVGTAKAGKSLYCTRCVCPGDTQYRDYYCDSSTPNFSYCDCSCYAKQNYDTSKPGGCNTWVTCK